MGNVKQGFIFLNTLSDSNKRIYQQEMEQGIKMTVFPLDVWYFRFKLLVRLHWGLNPTCFACSQVLLFCLSCCLFGCYLHQRGPCREKVNHPSKPLHLTWMLEENSYMVVSKAMDVTTNNLFSLLSVLWQHPVMKNLAFWSFILYISVSVFITLYVHLERTTM